MPRIHNTPESALSRADSKDHATTCRGLTTQGRPCRRALASSATPSPASTPHKWNARQDATDISDLYCWQHKDQAQSAVPTLNDHSSPVKPRTSIDTLMDRLGVLDIQDKPSRKAQPSRKKPGRPQRPVEKRRPRRTFCCFEIVDDNEDHRPAAPVPRPAPTRPQQKVRPSPAQTLQRPNPPYHGRHSSSSSQTPALLSWIPKDLPPQTTSVLLAELAKPISTADDQGYIYMFWITPQKTTRDTQPPVPRDVAASIMPTSHSNDRGGLRPPAQDRSISDALRAARDLDVLTTKPSNSSPGTIRLKIGRTSNVHRRLAEWTRQCSYDLTLIRYYPYTPSSPCPSPARKNSAVSSETLSQPGRKVPHVHRVERLIHLELDDLRLRDLGRCEECGKEHREWFEVEAAKDALRRVDDCVRRWISWAESMP
ncbi:hypothetical protein N7539_000294 [Penicillium diatomitis]|uniref:Bacteriophage T5 Orf172 DNA-binding domain-containing protein n=1 Tax=Penicillium diatomitis TaxID=2819901 RepID=A0A9W9XLP0_9EURO|nr:uncharacterized protein N7539_000294 [Penicillium diatomitis]KAJ5495178.1 hypothetical protein N7539_000294 [Penicillium diatomitis]